MKQLTTQQIQEVDKKLINLGFTFIDHRIEVLDHILCLIEEKESEDVNCNIKIVFEEQRDYLKTQKLTQWTNVMSQRVSLLKDIFLNPVFIFLWILSYFIYDNLPYSNYNLLLEDLDVIPMAIPILSFVFLGAYTFVSKNKVAGTYGALFTISFIMMFYLYFGIHWVRKMEQFPSLLLLSGFTAVSLMLYYLLFYYKIKNDQKFKMLLNK
ncbi:hypothetical protein H1R17_04610 [Flavobacterium sp. xlx-214]|uniref:hypothetical protein n=1 Tax=unclassified Flavobacterium TaxID=196869 RepID=UPI0013D09CB6|nr:MULTISPECIES: hypothetical protein [unclassified Flavobacterium]MBA5792175.1 hypothetical protein [Flavobacterium sp. xlx-221]QMI84419.1 hypothetical protein H1R17_04610 [Flavobacterium sp. xlx-214]